MRDKNGSPRLLMALAIAATLLGVAGPVRAQNTASQKAYFGSGTTEILAPEGDIGIYGQLKTSSVGDLMIGVSMECSLWTKTSNTAKKGGGNTTSSSRAAVNVTVYVDGEPAEPGQVVFCDREQIVNLNFSSDTQELTDAITLELFQKTKNAQHFNFYALNLGSGVHTVEAHVDSFVEVSADSPQTVVDGTRAAIGKRSLVIEEYNNP